MNVEYCNAISAPEFLDVKFFQQVLENKFLGAYGSIKKISFENGSAGGENYCSEIYRVRVTIQRDSAPLEDVSVIVKSISVTEHNQFLEVLGVFLKEKTVYYHILPKMEILLDEAKFGPKMYYDCKEPINTLVFEDLSPLGYIMADRVKGLDLNHTQIVMKKIGQFHGISMILHKKDPDCMKAFGNGMFAKQAVNSSQLYDSIFANNLQGVIGLLGKWKGYEHLIPKLQNFANNLKENLVKSQLPIPGEIKVLNHGDFWVNNMMFKYTKNGEVEDVVFIDLQISIYGSPGLDLNYFLYSSPQLCVLKEKREEVLKTYHEAMCEVLKLHNYDAIPSFDDILTEVGRRERFGFITNYALMPVIVMEKDQSSDNSIDSFCDEEVLKNKTDIMMSSQRYQETLKYTLKRFEELGVLD